MNRHAIYLPRDPADFPVWDHKLKIFHDDYDQAECDYCHGTMGKHKFEVCEVCHYKLCMWCPDFSRGRRFSSSATCDVIYCSRCEAEMQYAPLRCSVRSPSPHRTKCDNMLLCSSCLEKGKVSESCTHCVQAFVPLFFPKWVDGSKRSKQDKQAMEARTPMAGMARKFVSKTTLELLGSGTCSRRRIMERQRGPRSTVMSY